MKDRSQKSFERSRPVHSPRTCIEHCLRQLYEDYEHASYELAARELIYEELIGALLVGRDALDAIDALAALEEKKCEK